MYPEIALDLSTEAIRLLHRERDHWSVLDEIRLDTGQPISEEAMRRLRDSARAIVNRDGGAPIPAEMIIPPEQIRYMTLRAGAASDPQSVIRGALARDAVLPLEDLRFDWSTEHDETQVAVVARQTLEEARDFAEAHGFAPARYSARPEPEQFSGAPEFAVEAEVAPEPEMDPQPEPVADAPVIVPAQPDLDRATPPHRQIGALVRAVETPAAGGALFGRTPQQVVVPLAPVAATMSDDDLPDAEDDWIEDEERPARGGLWMFAASLAALAAAVGFFMTRDGAAPVAETAPVAPEVLAEGVVPPPPAEVTVTSEVPPVEVAENTVQALPAEVAESAAQVLPQEDLVAQGGTDLTAAPRVIHTPDVDTTNLPGMDTPSALVAPAAAPTRLPDVRRAASQEVAAVESAPSNDPTAPVAIARPAPVAAPVETPVSRTAVPATPRARPTTLATAPVSAPEVSEEAPAATAPVETASVTRPRARPEAVSAQPTTQATPQARAEDAAPAPAAPQVARVATPAPRSRPAGLKSKAPEPAQNARAAAVERAVRAAVQDADRAAQTASRAASSPSPRLRPASLVQ